MTNQQHPITPPPELATHWLELWNNMPVPRPVTIQYIATQAAQWGADQELEACYYWIENYYGTDAADSLQQGRRPKPPSLKEQALEKLTNLEQGINSPGFNDYNTIRRALESIND